MKINIFIIALICFIGPSRASLANGERDEAEGGCLDSFFSCYLECLSNEMGDPSGYVAELISDLKNCLCPNCEITQSAWWQYYCVDHDEDLTGVLLDADVWN